MNDRDRLWPWFVANWSRAGLPCALLSLAWLVLFLTDDNRSLVLLFTLLPVYMIHQVEEHAHGRFVAEFNAMLGGGRPLLTIQSAFWTNIVGVWGLFLVSFALARWVALGFALVPVFLTVVNGLTHVGMATRLRSSNPGLITSLFLFLPWGGFLLVYFNREIDSPVRYDLLGLAVAVIVHALIVGFALRRRAALAGEPIAISPTGAD